MKATLQAWPERRIIDAMRGWRRGCGPLLPWFRATPFAAAHHYRERQLPIAAPRAAPAAARQLVTGLPPPARDTLWIFDLPGPLALWLGHELRCRWAMGAALCWNAWYDPRGILDGREEIPLLLALGLRLARRRVTRGTCLVFDSRRGQLSAAAGEAAHREHLDNGYELNEEDAPTAEQLAAMRVRSVHAFTWTEPASDLAAYLEYLESRVGVAITDRLVLKTEASD
ncbi:MAG TPA: hypothetical protein VEL75_19415 [Candidatus Methylomirabilis sp.]|nr:hypothetical protein [Candidatus Methylomirabilis sp.]